MCLMNTLQPGTSSVCSGVVVRLDKVLTDLGLLFELLQTVSCTWCEKFVTLNMYDFIRYKLVPPVFLVFFTVVTQGLVVLGNNQKLVTSVFLVYKLIIYYLLGNSA